MKSRHLALLTNVPIGKRHYVLVERQLVTSADEVADFVRQRLGGRRALVMHHGKGVCGVGIDAG